VYHFYYKYIEETIYQELETVARISAVFYFDEDELQSNEFDKVRSQYELVVAGSRFHYQIYDYKNNLLYGKLPTDISKTVLDEIRSDTQLNFKTKKSFCYGLFYKDNQGDFVVVAQAGKSEFKTQMRALFRTLILNFFLGIICIITLSRWVSHLAYRPFNRVISQMKNISVSNLAVKIDTPNTKDELQNMTEIFNGLLSNISDTFVIQKNFVSYISHEFRTPLASMLGNIEIFSVRDSSPKECEELLKKLSEQIYQMEDILNALIIISDLRKDADTIDQIPVDDVIWEILDKIKETYHDIQISVNINIRPEDERLMSVMIERTQLMMALYNLIENAAKYSSAKPILINILKRDDRLCIMITDQGIGIPKEQLDNISKPFYRAKNTGLIQGSGIGLSVALRILEKNGVEYKVESVVNVGTTIKLLFKKND